MLWILKGHTNTAYLQENGIHIWDKFAADDGEVGPMYQWRNWSHNGTMIDQLRTVINEIKSNPYSKRLVVSSWNVGELDNMALPPCPHIFQFVVMDGKLHCHLTQRAGDLILGVPYDLPVYALLTHLVAQVTDLAVGEIVHTIVDAHIYHNHRAMAQEMLAAEPCEAPRLELDQSVKDIDDFDFQHMKVVNYHPVTTMTAPVAVGPLFKAFFHR